MTVNGQPAALREAVSLGEFLRDHGYDTQRVAVERNGSIVPRKDYETQTLSDADRLEIVCFVGGG
ncbi:MAG: sulfur carrier protein ThiS [Oscillospiraceae bacterium]|nr:sulfur carrier protein ThiS [Oscillospiraceae bacterium]